MCIFVKRKYLNLLTIFLKDLDIFNVNIEKSLTNTYTNIADIQVCLILSTMKIYIFELQINMGIKFLEKDANDEFIGVLSSTKLSFCITALR